MNKKGFNPSGWLVDVYNSFKRHKSFEVRNKEQTLGQGNKFTLNTECLLTSISGQQTHHRTPIKCLSVSLEGHSHVEKHCFMIWSPGLGIQQSFKWWWVHVKTVKFQRKRWHQFQGHYYGNKWYGSSVPSFLWQGEKQAVKLRAWVRCSKVQM